MSPCTAYIFRPAAENPGYRPTAAWIIIDVDGTQYRILVDVPAYGSVEATNAQAQAIVDGVTSSSMDSASLKADHARACRALEATAEAERLARMRLTEVLTGSSRRLFGRARVVMATDGVWLQDHAKGDAGMGLWFPSLTALWRDMPGLRPVAWSDAGLIVESFNMEETP